MRIKVEIVRLRGLKRHTVGILRRNGFQSLNKEIDMPPKNHRSDIYGSSGTLLVSKPNYKGLKSVSTQYFEPIALFHP